MAGRAKKNRTNDDPPAHMGAEDSSAAEPNTDVEMNDAWPAVPSSKVKRGRNAAPKPIGQKDKADSDKVEAYRRSLLHSEPEGLHRFVVGEPTDAPLNAEDLFPGPSKEFVDHMQYLGGNKLSRITLAERAEKQIAKYSVAGPSEASQEWHKGYVDMIKVAYEKMLDPGLHGLGWMWDRDQYQKALQEWSARTLTPPPYGFPYKSGERYCGDPECDTCKDEREEEAIELQHSHFPAHKGWVEHGCEVGHLKGGPLRFRAKVYACVSNGVLSFRAGRLTPSNLFRAGSLQASEPVRPQDIAPNPAFPSLVTTRWELRAVYDTLANKGSTNAPDFNNFVRNLKDTSFITLLEHRDLFTNALEIFFPLDFATLAPGRAIAGLASGDRSNALELPIAFQFGRPDPVGAELRNGALVLASHDDARRVAKSSAGSNADDHRTEPMTRQSYLAQQTAAAGQDQGQPGERLQEQAREARGPLNLTSTAAEGPPNLTPTAAEGVGPRELQGQPDPRPTAAHTDNGRAGSSEVAAGPHDSGTQHHAGAGHSTHGAGASGAQRTAGQHQPAGAPAQQTPRKRTRATYLDGAGEAMDISEPGKLAKHTDGQR